MKPTEGRVFVEIKKLTNSKFIEGQPYYVVTHTGPGVTLCKPGDYILADSFHEYEYNGLKIIKVNEQDIDGVCPNELS